jgi:hypothetical protein
MRALRTFRRCKGDKMIEIKVPPTPAGAPEQLFLGSLISYVDREPRLAKPVSRVVVGIRLVEAAEEAKATGTLQLRDEDHALLCQLLETGEASFVELFSVDPETKEATPIEVNPRLERAYVATILKAKPVDDESVAQAAE